jgi:dolichol-phosphate mannosyltransferase
MTRLSIVVPVLNEQPNIRPVYERTRSVLERIPMDFEFLFVDDGSTDGTFAEITALNKEDPRVRAIRLSRTFGHQMALTAGTDLATGDAVVHMDGDLQHPPELLEEMIKQWRQGFDIVYTVRAATKQAGISKRITQLLFYPLFRWLTRVDLPPNAADFRLLDRKVAEALRQIRERIRFVRGLTRWVGYRSIGIPYVAHERFRGETKYDWQRMIRFAVDGIVSFSAVPLLVAIWTGLACVLVAVPYMIYVVVVRLLLDQAVSGWASIIMVIMGMGGVQLILLGVMGLYIGKMYEEVKQRPLYLVQETIGLDKSLQSAAPLVRP